MKQVYWVNVYRLGQNKVVCGCPHITKELAIENKSKLRLHKLVGIMKVTLK